MTSKLYPYKFQENDRVIQIRKISPRLVKEAMDAIDKPQAPLQKVTYPDGHDEWEANEAAPDYLKRMSEYNQTVAIAANDLMIERGTVIELTDEEREEVKDLKAFWQKRYKKELDGSDKFIFVAHICCGTQEDIRELIQFIGRRSNATPEGTAQALDSFRGDVQGPETK